MFLDVFDPVKIAGVEHEDAPLAEVDDVVRLVHRADRQVRFNPAAGDDGFAVGDCRPGLDVGSGEAKFGHALKPVVVLPFVGEATTLKVPCLGHRARESRVPSSQSSRMSGALSLPLSVATQASCPFTLVRVPAGEANASAENWLLASIGLPDRRCAGAPESAGVSVKHSVEEIRSSPQHDADRLARRVRRISRARLRALGWRSHRPVSPARIGGGQRAGPGVIAVGRHVDCRLVRNRRCGDGPTRPEQGACRQR